MISSREVLTNVVNCLDQRTKKRVLNTLKQYVIIELHIFNTGYFVTAKVTNKYIESEHPKFLFLTEEIQQILTN